jgi:nitrate ABC transporter ATP-binding subunit
MSLVVDSIHKTYGSQDVLRGIDLTVEPGEFVTVIGHSGCGKSTLLNAIGGLIDVDSGAMSLDDEPISGPGPDRAIVFQSYSLLPWMTVYSNVYEAAASARPDRTKAQTREIVEHYLRSTGLWDQREKKPAQISGGMRQRTAVARGFAVGPKVLLLDEPFGALDALTRAQLQQQLVELWSRDKGETEIVLMVTHGIDEAILLADRVVVMANPPAPSIAAVIEVDLPRPRTKASMAGDPRFHELLAQLTDMLQNELAPPALAA